METWLQIVVALGVAAGILVLVAAPRRGQDERRSSSGSDVASGMLGELLEIFQPSRTTLTEERERVRHDKQQAGSAAPPFGVDLDAGTAVLPGRSTASAAPEGRLVAGTDAAEGAGGRVTESAGGRSVESVESVESVDSTPSDRD